MPTPSVRDAYRDLLEQPAGASLSTIGPDGTPQVTALWYLAEGDTIGA